MDLTSVIVPLVMGKMPTEEGLRNALYEICDEVHSSCNDTCPVFEFNGRKMPVNPEHPDQGCPYHKDATLMLDFLKTKVGCQENQTMMGGPDTPGRAIPPAHVPSSFKLDTEDDVTVVFKVVDGRYTASYIHCRRNEYDNLFDLISDLFKKHCEIERQNKPAWPKSGKSHDRILAEVSLRLVTQVNKAFTTWMTSMGRKPRALALSDGMRQLFVDERIPMVVLENLTSEDVFDMVCKWEGIHVEDDTLSRALECAKVFRSSK